jgi:hypothetical protein
VVQRVFPSGGLDIEYPDGHYVQVYDYMVAKLPGSGSRLSSTNRKVPVPQRLRPDSTERTATSDLHRRITVLRRRAALAKRKAAAHQEKPEPVGSPRFAALRAKLAARRQGGGRSAINRTQTYDLGGLRMDADQIWEGYVGSQSPREWLQDMDDTSDDSIDREVALYLASEPAVGWLYETGHDEAGVDLALSTMLKEYRDYNRVASSKRTAEVPPVIRTRDGHTWQLID